MTTELPDDLSHTAQRLLTSWDHNASAWTAAVRGQQIPSRRAGTDAAIVRACERVGGSRVLDVGCGEGWLARALVRSGREVVGIDASAGLIAEATSASRTSSHNAATGDESETGMPTFHTLSYDQLIADREVVPGPWSLIVCNFALLGDPLTPLLRALADRLATDGRLLIQTVHPWMAVGDGAYVNAWREESFLGFGVAFPAAMPWYFRTLGSWVEQVQAAGLRIHALDEPLHPDTGRPLSMLLECALTG